MSTTTKQYNGWTNYETWAVNLWMTNDEGSEGWLRDAAQEAYDDAEADATFTRKENAAFALADVIQAEIEEGNPLSDKPSLFSDLLSAALSEVDWHEIATSHLDDVDEEEETAEEEEEEEETDEETTD